MGRLLKVVIGFGLGKTGLFLRFGLILVRLMFIRLALGAMFTISDRLNHLVSDRYIMGDEFIL